jgi:hypothetical protein
MRRSPVIKKNAARFAQTPVRLGEGAEPAPPEETRPKDPVVEVRRRGELVEAIEVTCPCGNHMVIEALYDARNQES